MWGSVWWSAIIQRSLISETYNTYQQFLWMKTRIWITVTVGKKLHHHLFDTSRILMSKIKLLHIHPALYYISLMDILFWKNFSKTVYIILQLNIRQLRNCTIYRLSDRRFTINVANCNRWLNRSNQFTRMVESRNDYWLRGFEFVNFKPLQGVRSLWNKLWRERLRPSTR
jgi:hypothetical protein